MSHVAGRAERLDLPGEDLVEAEVVADAGSGLVPSEASATRGERPPVVLVAAPHSSSERWSASAALPPLPAVRDLAAGEQGLGHDLGAAVELVEASPPRRRRPWTSPAVILLDERML